MKKVTLVLTAAIFASGMANAQKAKVSSAENSIILKQYDQAKTSIDEALANEKSNSWPKTYTVASDLYSALAAEGKDAEGVEKAKAYLKKAMELDAKGDAKGKGIGKHDKDIKRSMLRFATNATNYGVNCFNSKDYAKAKFAFADAVWANSFQENYNEANDSILIYNAAIAAMQDSDYKMAAEYFDRSFKVDYEGPMSILRMNYCYAQLKDTANIELTLKKGFEKYPDNKDILTTLIQHYLSSKQNEAALVYLNQAIEKDPNNAQFYYARGCLNEKIDTDAAIKDYATAIEKNPKLFNALYNMAVVYYNMGVEKVSEANNERDQAKYDAAMAQANDLFKQSIPYMDKAAEAAEDVESKKATLETLKNLYYRLNDTDKYQETVNKIKEL